MQITVKIKTLYGNDLIYPICDKAKSFAAIAGSITLTTQAIKEIKNLGYSIKIDSPINL